MRGHAASRRFVIEQQDCVRRPARLECADLLKVFALKKERAAAGRIEARARQHRGAMNVRKDPLVRGANSSKIHRHGYAPGRASFPKRFPTVNRSETGSSSARKLRNRSEK